MRFLIPLILLAFAFPAMADPSSEARMKFMTGTRSCSLPLSAGQSCLLTIAIAETERATNMIGAQHTGFICVDGDTSDPTAASTIGLTWNQSVGGTTIESIPVGSSTSTLNSGTDCWATVGSGWLSFTSAPTTEVKIIFTGM